MSFEMFTPYTIGAAEELLEQCETIRDTGFATADREEAPQVTGIAAPVWNDEGKHVASLSLWTTTQHHDAADVVNQSGLLTKIAQSISAELGAVDP